MIRTDQSLSSQEAYVRRITVPKSPEDLVLALQNPLSPAYKNMMNMLFANMMMDIIIEKLINKYLLHAYRLNKIERADIERGILINLEHQKQLFADMPVYSEKLFEDLGRYHSDEIKSIAAKCMVEMAEIKDQINIANKKIIKLDKAEQVNLENWEALKKEQVSQLTEELQREQIPIYVRDVKTQEYCSIDGRCEMGQAILENACASPHPAQFINALSTSFKSKKEMVNATKPGIKDVMKKLPANLAITQAFKICNSCVNEPNEPEESHVEGFDRAKAILDAMKYNRALLNKIADPVKDAAAPYVEQYRIHDERNQVNQLKQRLEYKMKQNEYRLNQCQQRIRELTHHSLDLDPMLGKKKIV